MGLEGCEMGLEREGGRVVEGQGWKWGGRLVERQGCRWGVEGLQMGWKGGRGTGV